MKTLILIIFFSLLGVTIYGLLSMYKEWHDLKKWRSSLKRGDKVRVVGFDKPVNVHKNKGSTLTILTKKDQGRFYYTTATKADVFPPLEEDVEWEII